MKGKNMSIALMIVLTVVVMATGCGSKEKEPEKTGDVVETSSVEEVKEEPIFKMDAFAKANYLTIEKVKRTIVEGDDGAYDTTYDSYVVSDISLSDASDKTDNYAKAVAGGEFNENLIESVDFAEVFGISYAGKDGQEILAELLEANGFGSDFTNLEFDEETHKLTGQNTYLLKDCSALNGLADAEAEKIIKKEAYVQVTKDSNGNVVPEFFSAQVQYLKDGKTVTKSLYLQVTVNAYSSGEEG